MAIAALQFKIDALIQYFQADDFTAGYMPGTLNFSLGDAGGAIVGPEDGNFAIWVSSHTVY